MRHLNRILVTTDFSGNSRAGIRFALQLSKQTGASLVFYHIVEVDKPTAWNDFRFEAFRRSRIKLFTSRLIRYVDAICRENAHPVSGHSYMVELGTNVPEMVARQATRQKADAVCMSTRGGGRIRKLIGSNSAEVIRTSKIPVIAVPRKYRVAAIDRIMFACDFTSAGRELNILNSFVKPIGAEITVYHFLNPLYTAEQLKKFEERAKGLEKPNVSFVFRQRRNRDELDQLIRSEIRKTRPSLLVLFTSTGDGWIEKYFKKSETLEISSRPQVPILIFNRKSERGQNSGEENLRSA